MKKEELIEKVMEMAGIETKKQATAAVDAVFEVITKVLSKGGDITITNFGTFKVMRSKARVGVNPKTGAKIQIAACTKPKFRAGKGLKDAVK